MKYLLNSACLSPCRKYRYTLTRRWKNQGHICVFIGLNPSTADEKQDDPTIRRCVSFARSWGYAGLVMLNLFAFRATDPQEMMRACDPIGPDNDRHIARQCLARKSIAVWGKQGKFLSRETAVRSIVPRLYCLKLNKDGSPSHPLYLKGTLKPTIFNVIQ